MQVAAEEPLGNSTRRPSLLALCAFIPSLVIIIACIWHWYADVQADKTAESTIGVITQAESADYRYKYYVNGAEFAGEEIIKGRGTLVAGEEVHVTYRPEEPATSTLTPPFGDTDSRPVPMILAVIGGLYLYFRLRGYLIRRSKANLYEGV